MGLRFNKVLDNYIARYVLSLGLIYGIDSVDIKKDLGIYKNELNKHKVSFFIKFLYRSAILGFSGKNTMIMQFNILKTPCTLTFRFNHKIEPKKPKIKRIRTKQ